MYWYRSGRKSVIETASFKVKCQQKLIILIILREENVNFDREKKD